MGLTPESIVWLIFSKKYFLFFFSKHNFENSWENIFKIKKKVFNGIVVNKLETMDPTDLFKLFYLLNQGVYLYYKQILTLQIWNLSLSQKKGYISCISTLQFWSLSLSNKKGYLHIMKKKKKLNIYIFIYLLQKNSHTSTLKLIIIPPPPKKTKKKYMSFIFTLQLWSL